MLSAGTTNHLLSFRERTFRFSSSSSSLNTYCGLLRKITFNIISSRISKGKARFMKQLGARTQSAFVLACLPHWSRTSRLNSLIRTFGRGVAICVPRNEEARHSSQQTRLEITTCNSEHIIRKTPYTRNLCYCTTLSMLMLRICITLYV